MHHSKRFIFSKDVPGALAMNKPPRGGLFGEVAHPTREDISKSQDPLHSYSLDFIREASVLGSADISGKVKYPAFSYFQGPMISTVCFIVRYLLYKGKDPITCEPVVLGGCISRDGLLNSLPKDSYQRNAMSGCSSSKDKWFHHYAAYIDLPQTIHRPEHLVKSCGIKPVELKYEF